MLKLDDCIYMFCIKAMPDGGMASQNKKTSVIQTLVSSITMISVPSAILWLVVVDEILWKFCGMLDMPLMPSQHVLFY